MLTEKNEEKVTREVVFKVSRRINPKIVGGLSIYPFNFFMENHPNLRFFPFKMIQYRPPLSRFFFFFFFFFFKYTGIIRVKICIVEVMRRKIVNSISVVGCWSFGNLLSKLLRFPGIQTRIQIISKFNFK